MKKFWVVLPVLALMALGICLPKADKVNEYINNAEAGPVLEVSVDSFDGLKEALRAEENSCITIEEDILISNTLYTGNANYTILASKDVTLTRAEGFVDDLVYIDKNSTLSVGEIGSSNKIVFDGNGLVATDVPARIFENHGTLNLTNGVSVTNVSGNISGCAIYNAGNCNLDKVSIHDNVMNNASVYAMIYSTTGANLVINNSEIFNNRVDNASGAAIFVNVGGSAWISGSKFYNNTTNMRGGAIVAKGCEMTVRNCLFYENHADYGAAIHAYEGGNVSINGSEFYGNVATHYGAISSISTNLSLVNVNVHDNTAINKGGALYIESTESLPATLTVNGGNFLNNVCWNAAQSSGYGGAVHIKSPSTTASIFGATFKNNKAVYGGAISVENSNLMMAGGLVEGNTATNGTASTGYGGGLYLNTNAQVELHDVVISKNNAIQKGGAVNLFGESDLVMYGAKIYSNTSKYGAGVGVENGTFTQESGEIMYNVSSASGCGVFVDKGFYKLNDGKLSFNKTTGSNGGAINNKDKVYINGGIIEGNSAQWAGGAIHSYISDTSDDVRVVVTGGTFKDNGKVLTIDGESATVGEAYSYYGGAININSGLLQITGGTFVSNATTKDGSNKYGYGGAVCVQGGTAEISGATFSQNDAITGGAVYVTAGTLKIENSIFEKNTSKKEGGAVYLKDVAGTVSINDCLFDQNTATTYAGAIYTTGSVATSSRSTYTKNIAVSGAGAVAVYDSGEFVVNSGTFSGNNATAEAEGVRGKDLYIYGAAKATSTAKATVNGGTFENIGVHYGKISVGGNVSVSEKIMTWAGVAENNVNMIVHDELKNPIVFFCRYNVYSDSLTQNYMIQINNKTTKDPFKLIYNIVVDDAKAYNYYVDYNRETGKATIKQCAYTISSPTDVAIAVRKGANADEVVTFAPIAGYSISNVKYNGIEIVADATGEYSFVMPGSNVEITYDCELAPVDILIDDDAKGLLNVVEKATLDARVEVTLAESTTWFVDNVYYNHNGQKVYLTNRQGKYYFTMFDGVKLFVEKTPLYQIVFSENNILAEDSSASVDGKKVVSALAGKEVELEIFANDYKYLLDIENSYYMIEGDSTKHSIKTLNFVMPEANVVIYTVFANVYSDLKNVVEVYTFEELKQVLTTATDADIILKADIEIGETITLASNTNYTLVAFGNRTIKRASGFTKTMFVLPEFTNLTLGMENILEGVECNLVFDGNSTVVKNTVGSLFAVINSSQLVMNEFVTLTNNKVGKNEYGSLIERVSGNAGGGALMIFSGKFVMNGGEISYNSASGYGGAIYSHGYVELNAGKISYNTSTLHGGAIYTNRVLRINGGEISYNSLTTSDANGAGVYCANNFLSIMTMTGGKFEGNSSKASAGALYIGTRATLTIYDGEFVDNRSSANNAGAIYLYGKATIYKATFRANYAKGNGGAIYVNSGDTVNINGELFVEGATFDGNNAGYGGGAIAVHRLATAYIKHDDIEFKNNSAVERGGAIYVMSDSDLAPSKAIVLNGRFQANTAKEGNDIAVQYGVLEIGGKVSNLDVRTVANPRANCGYIKVVEELENFVTIKPISYTVDTITGDRFFRAEAGVDVANIFEKVIIPQPSNTTYCLVYKDGEFTLRNRVFMISVAGNSKAISVVPNADNGEEVVIQVQNGYKVSNLKYNGTDIVGNKFVMPRADVEITFDATLIEYQITVAEGLTGGQIALSQNKATVEDVVTITLTPDQGWFVTQLYINKTLVEVEGNSIEILVEADTTISAKFEKIKYMICYNFNYDNKTEMKSVYAGELIKEKTPTRKGFEFGGWYVDKALTQQYDFTAPVYGVVQLYAKWTEK